MSATTTSASETSTPTCLPIPPKENGYVPPGGCGNIHMYEASFAAPVLFSVLFGLTTIIHIVQAIMFKKVRPHILLKGKQKEKEKRNEEKGDKKANESSAMPGS
jgi:hypothetical protein